MRLALGRTTVAAALTLFQAALLAATLATPDALPWPQAGARGRGGRQRRLAFATGRHGCAASQWRRVGPVALRARGCRLRVGIRGGGGAFRDPLVVWALGEVDTSDARLQGQAAGGPQAPTQEVQGFQGACAAVRGDAALGGAAAAAGGRREWQRAVMAHGDAGDAGRAGGARAARSARALGGRGRGRGRRAVRAALGDAGDGGDLTHRAADGRRRKG
eukprot:3457971-Prymnesium_polylepis.1